MHTRTVSTVFIRTLYVSLICELSLHRIATQDVNKPLVVLENTPDKRRSMWARISAYKHTMEVSERWERGAWDYTWRGRHEECDQQHPGLGLRKGLRRAAVSELSALEPPRTEPPRPEPPRSRTSTEPEARSAVNRQSLALSLMTHEMTMLCGQQSGIIANIKYENRYWIFQLIFQSTVVF